MKLDEIIEIIYREFVKNKWEYGMVNPYTPSKEKLKDDTLELINDMVKHKEYEWISCGKIRVSKRFKYYYLSLVDHQRGENIITKEWKIERDDMLLEVFL